MVDADGGLAVPAVLGWHRLRPRYVRAEGATARSCVNDAAISFAGKVRCVRAPSQLRHCQSLPGGSANRMTTGSVIPIQPRMMPAVARPEPVCVPADFLIWLRARYPKISASTAPIPANHSSASSSDAMARPLT